MIKKSEAHKHYPRDTQIIRKGDAGWKSDRENYQRPEGTREDKEYLLGTQRHISNPLSVMDQKIRQRASRDVNMEDLPSVDSREIGDIESLVLPNGRDLMCFRLVEHVETFMECDPEQTWERRRRQWKYCWVQKNGAL